MDHVAGRLAFYTPFFKPALVSAIETHGRLTFHTIEVARDQAAPSASLLATAFHSIKYMSEPMLLISVDLNLKKSEARAVSSLQQHLDIARPKIIPKLQITILVPNERAKKRFFEIKRNMRVPKRSVLMQAFESPSDIDLEAEEDQDWWETSQSGRLSPMPIRVEAVRRGRFVYGLVSPLE